MNQKTGVEQKKESTLFKIEKYLIVAIAIVIIALIYFKLGWWDLSKTITWESSLYTRFNPPKYDKKDPTKPKEVLPPVEVKYFEDITKFYWDYDCTGDVLNLEVGLYDLTEDGGLSKHIQNFNFEISSLQVHPAHKVRVYTKTAFQGAFADFYWTKETDGKYNVTEDFNDNIQSIEIVPSNQEFLPMSSFYTETDYGGYVMRVREGEWFHEYLVAFSKNEIKLAADAFRSAKIHRKHKIRAYEHDEGQGRYIDFEPGKNYPTLGDLNSLISTLKVYLV